MKTRTDLLNHLAEKYKLERYLEIGVQYTENNFDKIRCKSKLSVDPDWRTEAIIRSTSDDFFESWLELKGRIIIPYFRNNIAQLEYDKEFDLIFIDGLHTAEQVKKDFENALKVLSPNGFIVLHDCNPLKEEHTIVPRPTERGHWNGDVYKFACQLATNWLSFKTVDIDNGCGVYYHCTPTYSLGSIPTWQHFDANRKELLNLISWEDFIQS